ncbi:MAG: phosphatase PAP2 family protein [Patescibacteria group bacterium]
MDTQLFYLLNSLAGKSQFFDSTVVFFASYFPYVLVVALLALVFFSQHPKLEKLEILLTIAISSVIARFGVTEIIRFFYHRPRPFLTLQTHQLLTDNAWSFPSGHATFFFAMAAAAYLYNKKFGVFFFIVATLITASRVIAGIHYPSDIIGGAIIGIAVACITYYLVRKLISTTRHTDGVVDGTIGV